MRWLITLKTEDGLIVPCRLMNAFRCKGLKIVTLAMAARPCGYSMMAVVEPPEGADADYIFNFLRRMGGVQSVVINKKPPSAEKEEYEIVFFAPPAPK